MQHRLFRLESGKNFRTAGVGRKAIVILRHPHSHLIHGFLIIFREVAEPHVLVLLQALFAGVTEDELELASVSLPSAVRNVNI